MSFIDFESFKKLDNTLFFRFATLILFFFFFRIWTQTRSLQIIFKCDWGLLLTSTTSFSYLLFFLTWSGLCKDHILQEQVHHKQNEDRSNNIDHWWAIVVVAAVRVARRAAIHGWSSRGARGETKACNNVWLLLERCWWCCWQWRESTRRKSGKSFRSYRRRISTQHFEFFQMEIF